MGGRLLSRPLREREGPSGELGSFSYSKNSTYLIANGAFGWAADEPRRVLFNRESL